MKSQQITENINNSKDDEIQYEVITSQTEFNIPKTSKKIFERENSKNEGSTYYLASDNEEFKINLNNENENNKFQNMNNVRNIKQRIDKIIHNYNNLMSQRNIEFNIDKSEIRNIPNGCLTIKDKKTSKIIKVHNNKKNNLNILNKDDLTDYKNVLINKSRIKNFKPFNIKPIKKVKESINSNNEKNISDKNNTYKRKININQNPIKEDGINTKSNNNLNDFGMSRNEIINPKFQSQNAFTESEAKNKNDKKEKKVLNNEPILDILVKFENNSTHLNRSLEIKDNNSFSNSLNLFNDSINEKLNNCKIVDNAFLSGIKNEERKNSLKNALAIYNRFKKINSKLANINYPNNQINSDINTKQKESNKNEQKKEENEKENILNNLDLEEDNESEFSFNSKKKKKEEKVSTKNNNNQIKSIVIDQPNSINLNNSNSNYNEGNGSILISITDKNENNNKVDNFIDKINYKVKEDNDKEYKEDKEDRNFYDKNIEFNNKLKKLKRPSFYIRKLIREEHYYLDENGNEKIFEVKQHCINEEDKEKTKKPYIKKNMNLKSGFNSSKISTEKNNHIEVNNSLNNENNILNDNINDNIIKITKSKDLNLNNFKKKKINLIYDNQNGNANLQKQLKNALKIFESGSPRSLRLKKIKEENNSNNNDKFKDFKYYLFNEGKNSVNERTDIKKRNSNYKQYNTNNNTKRQRSPVVYSQKENYNTLKKDIFYIKKDRPIIIHSSANLINSNNTNRNPLKKPELSLTKINSININDIKDEHSLNYEESSNYINTTMNKVNENINNLDSYIKVNKVKKLNTDRILKINNGGMNINTNKKDFNKNHHVFHEIKITKNNLASNSQSNYFSNELSFDDLNISQHTNNKNKFSVKSINYVNKNGEKYVIKNLNNKNIFDINSNINKQKNFSIKSNSDSYFTLNNRDYRRINNEKSHHKYYESKSSKKKIDSDYESDGNTGRHTTYSSNIDKNNINKVYKINHKERYFYQNYDGINNIHNINRVLTQNNNYI